MRGSWRYVSGERGFFPPLPPTLFARNNAMAVALMTALPAVGGSAVSMLLALYFGWGIICVALGRFPLLLTPTDRIAVGAFSAYWLLILVTALFQPDPLDGLRIAAQLLPFLSLWVMIPRLRASPEVDYLSFMAAGAAIGAISATALGLWQVAQGAARPEAMAGNAGVYAILCLGLGALSAVNIDSPIAKRRWLAFAGIIAGGIGMTISLTRGVWLAALPIAVLMVLYAPRRWAQFRPATILGILALALAATVMFAGQFLLDLFHQTVTAFQTMALGDFTSSPGQRVRMWIAAAEAFGESPLWGYGIQNRMDVVIGHYPLNAPHVVPYSHAHNGFFSAAIDGGVLVLTALVAVLAAPVLVAARHRREPDGRRRLFAAWMLVLTVALCGLTQIMFKHDILDAFFVYTTAVIAASVPVASGRKS
ncbi:MAG: hypothetical protein DI629_11840 [Mesorhizobium amorphae]|nr:MAG: hypothetical protein DI629_11840 [Mesorhizobium amorphae]